MTTIYHFRPARKTNSRTFGLGLFSQKERKAKVSPYTLSDFLWWQAEGNREATVYSTEDEDERLKFCRTMTPSELAELRRAVRETLVIGETIATQGLSEADDAAMDSYIADLLAEDAKGLGAREGGRS